jgi:uncharacterized protein (DUF3820 family)
MALNRQDAKYAKMTMEQAYHVIMPFGKYSGRTLGEITHADLLYLDWLNGRDNLRDPLLTAVALICAERSAEIDSLVDQKD